MTENKDFLQNQIITYIGNKRKLLSHIDAEIIEIKTKLNKKKLISADLFSGSGIVARLLKQHSSSLFVNDLEKYSFILNDCYLTNKSDFNEAEYKKAFHFISTALKNLKTDGIIYNHYSPKNDEDIQKDERVFYTCENAKIIDTVRSKIEELPFELQNFFLAPLLYSASVNVNTGGVFKGFYKDKKTGIGKFGGSAENALSRIKGKIEILKPVFSNFECKIILSQEDANNIIHSIENTDIVYLDPPYNCHPYGSNYFMLNIIAENKLNTKISKVSGIPNNWNRSVYNKKNKASESLKKLIENCNSKYIITSYNSEGIISIEDIISILSKKGKLKIKEIPYNTYRASRNLHKRSVYVKEYLFILEK